MKKLLRSAAAALALAIAVLSLGACGEDVPEIEEKRFVFVGSGGAITVYDREEGASYAEIRADGTYFINIDFVRPEFKQTYEGKYDPKNGFEEKDGIRVTETQSGLTVSISANGMLFDARFVLEK